jgi:parallel beta-helix repeat protein
MKRLVLERVGLLSAALALAAFVVPGSGQALASNVSCGATITANTKLDSDLTNCPSNGIVIGADNITLDLNGRTVGGDGVPAGSCFEEGICDLGISNIAGHAGVTIKGGAVRGFDVGISVNGNDNRIQGVASANNSTFGMILGDSTGSRIDHNSSLDDGVSGILMFDSTDSRIDHNSVEGSQGYAMPVSDSSHNRLEQNVLTGDQHGILVEESSNDNDVTGNRISHGGSVEIGHSGDNRVEGNVLTDPSDGILLIDAQRTLVSDNSVTNAGVGFPEAGGFGILLDGADDNLVERNAVTGGNGPAIFVTWLESDGTSDRNVISHNVTNSRLSDGIFVNGNATATLVERNTANGNGHDGIEVSAPGTTLTRNTANFNHELGIEAVPGVIDGGGNQASGNGNPLQCTNVTCS